MKPELGRMARMAALAVGLGVPALVAVTIHRQQVRELANAEIRAANTAHALEQHAARTFETIDTYLRTVASLVGSGGDRLLPEAIHATLHEQFVHSRLNNIMVVDRTGRATVEADAFPARPLDVRDCDYFRTLRDRPEGGLVVGQPISGHLTEGRTVIPVARRIEDADGNFAGVVQAMVDPQAFQSVYDALNNGPDAGLTLWRADGTLLVRSPPLPSVIGRNFGEGENYRQHVPSRDTKPYWSPAMTDGVERVIALSFLEGYPLYVAAAFGRSDALADWRRTAVMQASVAGGLTLVLVAALLLLAREIERRQGADALIRASAERYRMLAENTSDLIVFKPTMTGRRSYVSPAVRAILGWEPEEYDVLPPAKLIHPEESDAIVAVYRALSPSRPQATHVHRLRHKAGHYVWIESVFKLVSAEPGDRTVVVSGRDISGRVEADRALRESEARLRLVSEAATDMITHLDPSGRRLYLSPASRDLLGYAPHELVGTQPQDTIHPDDVAGFESLLAELRGEGGERGTSVHRSRHRDGHWVWVEASLKRLRDEAGRTSGFVASVRDVEARKAVEAALLAAREEAERASAAKSEFLAAMSHEIRTPLNGVIGYADLLCEDAGLDRDARQHAERIRSAGAALLTVVNDVLDFSKIEAGQVEIMPRAFQPAALIDDAVSIVRGLADAKGLILAAALDAGVPSWLLGDEDRLRQVILNLLNNAVKFTARGRIDLHVAAETGPGGGVRLRFRVRDTGCGIPADKHDRLFRRFSQVDGSISREQGGTGLGLAISKALVERMEGTIGVESAVGSGSVFWFVVDLPAAAAPREVALPVPAPGGQTGRHLLLAEDVPLNRELARAILEGAGHTVDVVGDGGAAIAAVQASRYDLVLMDVQMPGVDGLTATRRIRALDGAVALIPIVALTANVLPQQVAAFRAAGMDDHVGKPFRRDVLLDAVERWGGRRQEDRDRTADCNAFDSLARAIGREAADQLLGSLAEELAQRFGVHAPAADRERLAQDAHAMISATAMLGFEDLAKQCRAVETACRSGADYAGLAAELRATSAAAVAEIGARRAA